MNAENGWKWLNWREIADMAGKGLTQLEMAGMAGNS